MDVSVGVGYYSDFEQSYSDATRVSGRGLAVYEGVPGKKWVFGVAYLNRAGATVLPVAGLIVESDELPRTRLDLIFPRPRFSWQTAASTPEDERWFYVGGEFGGGIWTVTPPLRSRDRQHQLQRPPRHRRLRTQKSSAASAPASKQATSSPASSTTRATRPTSPWTTQ